MTEPCPCKRVWSEPGSRWLCDKWLRKAEERAGLEPLKGSLWHAYRRKFATHMVNVPDRIMAKLGAWKTPRTLDLYSQPSEEVLAEALTQRRAVG